MTPEFPRVGLRRQVDHVDTDASGVMHCARYVALMETAILAMLEALGMGWERIRGLGLDVCMRAISIKYVAPAHFRETLAIEAEITRVGPAHVQAAARVLREDHGSEPALLATGLCELAFIECQSGRATRVPTELKELLEVDIHPEGAGTLESTALQGD